MVIPLYRSECLYPFVFNKFMSHFGGMDTVAEPVVFGSIFAKLVKSCLKRNKSKVVLFGDFSP